MNTLNTAYSVKVDTLETESGISIEDGTLHLYNGKLKLHSGGEIVDMNGYTETIVNISSSQILNMGSSPIELLPPPGAGKYYYFNSIFVEYTHMSVPYTLTANLYFGTDYQFPLITHYMLNNSFNSFITVYQSSLYVDDISGTSGIIVLSPSPLANNPLTLTTWDNSNPTEGNGTLRLKIYHKTITFGE